MNLAYQKTVGIVVAIALCAPVPAWAITTSKTDAELKALPQTGDLSSLAATTTLALAGMGALGAAVVVRRRKDGTD